MLTVIVLLQVLHESNTSGEKGTYSSKCQPEGAPERQEKWLLIDNAPHSTSVPDQSGPPGPLIQFYPMTYLTDESLIKQRKEGRRRSLSSMSFHFNLIKCTENYITK